MELLQVCRQIQKGMTCALNKVIAVLSITCTTLEVLSQPAPTEVLSNEKTIHLSHGTSKTLAINVHL